MKYRAGNQLDGTGGILDCLRDRHMYMMHTLSLVCTGVEGVTQECVGDQGVVRGVFICST